MSSIRREFGVPDPMLNGLPGSHPSLTSGHQVEQSEKKYESLRKAAEMEQLRKAQGLHAPLKLLMEQRLVSQVGHFPCISQRSNLLHDVLTGRDEIITPADMFGKDDMVGLSRPHEVLEKHFDARGGQC